MLTQSAQLPPSRTPKLPRNCDSFFQRLTKRIRVRIIAVRLDLPLLLRIIRLGNVCHCVTGLRRTRYTPLHRHLRPEPVHVSRHNAGKQRTPLGSLLSSKF